MILHVALSLSLSLSLSSASSVSVLVVHAERRPDIGFAICVPWLSIVLLARERAIFSTMTGLRLGAASRTAASAAESPSPGANASRELHTVRESDTATPSAESDTPTPDIDARLHARTLGEFDPMTPREAAAYASAVHERVEERPFESQPRLPRTPFNDAAAARELGAEGGAQPAELGQPGASDSPPVEPAEAAVAEAEVSERSAREQELVEDVEGAEQEGAAEAEIADEGAEEMEEEVRIPRWGGKSGPASGPMRVRCRRSACRRAVGRHQEATLALLHIHLARTASFTREAGSHARTPAHPHGQNGTFTREAGSYPRTPAHPHGRWQQLDCAPNRCCSSSGPVGLATAARHALVRSRSAPSRCPGGC